MAAGHPARTISTDASRRGWACMSSSSSDGRRQTARILRDGPADDHTSTIRRDGDRLPRWDSDRPDPRPGLWYWNIAGCGIPLADARLRCRSTGRSGQWCTAHARRTLRDRSGRADVPTDHHASAAHHPHAFHRPATGRSRRLALDPQHSEPEHHRLRPPFPQRCTSARSQAGLRCGKPQ